MRKIAAIRFRLTTYFIFGLACALSAGFTAHYYRMGQLLLYGDAESHLNIAKRVIGSITPGLAQLGGVWLPLPHVLLIPFVFSDSLWRSGLAGSIVSGISYIIAVIFIYLTLKKLTNLPSVSALGAGVFAINPNILYLQSTAMTELPLIAMFTVSQYYLLSYLQNDEHTLDLLYAAFFCFAATLTRYDGWFLVLTELAAIALHFGIKFFRSRNWKIWKQAEGTLLAFMGLAFFGITLWFLWDLTILGDPLYFTNSPYSARSQQNNWYAKGELPAYHNIGQSFLYYTVTAAENSGWIIFAIGVFGLLVFIFDRSVREKLSVILVLLTPYLFNIVTLFMGQSVIFIPSLTPPTFEWNLFNVRYGTLMVPALAFFCGYLLYRLKYWTLRLVIVGFILFQMFLYISGNLPVLTLEDARSGLSGMQRPDAEIWLKDHYDYGLIIMDDFARTVSIIKADIPMQNEIYVGNKPYYEESLRTPEKYLRWIVMQKDDEIWKKLYADQVQLDHVYKYFEKAYSSPAIVIFKRNQVPADLKTAVNL